MKTPTLEEINSAYNRICEGNDCRTCIIDRYHKHIGGKDLICGVAFTHAVLTGKLDIDGNPVAVSETETTTPTCSNPEQVPVKTALPKWCKVGQWVFVCIGGAKTLAKISSCLRGDVFHVDFHYDGQRQTAAFRISNLSPVRFREYTFEEAKELLGKQYTYKGGIGLVHSVTRSLDDGVVRIDGVALDSCQKYGYTIDGIPIGVPEVDEEAEQEAQE